MRQKLPRAIGTLGLVFVLFFSTPGGPYTRDVDLLSRTGLGLLILAWFRWYGLCRKRYCGRARQYVAGRGRLLSLGRSCIRALLGFSKWLAHWMYSLVDMAIYPVLFNQYLRYFIPGLDARVEWLISLAIIWGAAWINVAGQ